MAMATAVFGGNLAYLAAKKGRRHLTAPPTTGHFLDFERADTPLETMTVTAIAGYKLSFLSHLWGMTSDIK